jgi:TetR/AcrR family transcriptional regulator, transcriptional repressor for nem operon
MMQAAGMTNGGFYKHFDSKGEIVVEAIHSALNDVAIQLTSRVQGLPRQQALRAVIESYLSEEYLMHPEHGCAMAALDSELARMPLQLRRRVNDGLDAYEEHLSPLMPGDSDEQRHTAFVVLFSSMAGCLTAARAAADREERSRILAAGRRFFVRAFSGSAGKSLEETWQ